MILMLRSFLKSMIEGVGSRGVGLGKRCIRPGCFKKRAESIGKSPSPCNCRFPAVLKRARTVRMAKNVLWKPRKKTSERGRESGAFGTIPYRPARGCSSAKKDHAIPNENRPQSQAGPAKPAVLLSRDLFSPPPRI